MYNNIEVTAGTKSFFSKMSLTINMKSINSSLYPQLSKMCNYLLSLPSLIFFSVRDQKKSKQESIAVLVFLIRFVTLLLCNRFENACPAKATTS